MRFGLAAWVVTLFTILKLTGVSDASWLWVLSPFWIAGVLIAAIAGVVNLMAYSAALAITAYESKSTKK